MRKAELDDFLARNPRALLFLTGDTRTARRPRRRRRRARAAGELTAAGWSWASSTSATRRRVMPRFGVVVLPAVVYMRDGQPPNSSHACGTGRCSRRPATACWRRTARRVPCAWRKRMTDTRSSGTRRCPAGPGRDDDVRCACSACRSAARGRAGTPADRTTVAGRPRRARGSCGGAAASTRDGDRAAEPRSACAALGTPTNATRCSTCSAKATSGDGRRQRRLHVRRVGAGGHLARRGERAGRHAGPNGSRSPRSRRRSLRGGRAMPRDSIQIPERLPQGAMNALALLTNCSSARPATGRAPRTTSSISRCCRSPRWTRRC